MHPQFPDMMLEREFKQKLHFMFMNVLVLNVPMTLEIIIYWFKYIS